MYIYIWMPSQGHSYICMYVGLPAATRPALQVACTTINAIWVPPQGHLHVCVYLCIRIYVHTYIHTYCYFRGIATCSHSSSSSGCMRNSERNLDASSGSLCSRSSNPGGADAFHLNEFTAHVICNTEFQVNTYIYIYIYTCTYVCMYMCVYIGVALLNVIRPRRCRCFPSQ